MRQLTTPAAGVSYLLNGQLPSTDLRAHEDELRMLIVERVNDVVVSLFVCLIALANSFFILFVEVTLVQELLHLVLSLHSLFGVVVVILGAFLAIELGEDSLQVSLLVRMPHHTSNAG